MTSEEYYSTTKGKWISKRNAEMYTKYKNGITKTALKKEYNLSTTRISQIINKIERNIK